MDIVIPVDHSFGDNTIEFFEEEFGIEVGTEFEVPGMDVLEDMLSRTPEPVMFGMGTQKGALIMMHPHDL